ncbi:glycosyltransferase [Pseudoalteromonas sp. SG44-17]|uniref:glycosyltransferase n=1 Tax=Pseudoalteromonas sp. SG44-17 TaxID=2760963 RepID=UPI001601A386|nr:glycosyltransferase [Pseudoalteromonas sp. SG44-17]MBB1411677.1 glycosyltransferase [Pseudoalteromonas sp. SG44-17]
MNNITTRYNFFLNSLSIHQAPLIRKLAERKPVTVYYDNDISKARKGLGWSIPSFGNAELVKIDFETIDFDFLKRENNINIYSGIDAYCNINHCLNMIAPLSKSKNIVQMESINCLGFKGFLRKLKYMYLAYSYNGVVDAFLCQGSATMFKKLGFKNTYDFGYYLDRPFSENITENKNSKFLYLGSLSKNKQILDLVFAINGGNVSLDIYGAELDVTVADIEKAFRGNKSLVYKGVISHDLVPHVLRGYDYLILPSKKEGWGSVVSEALLSGVSVIVTDSAGIVNYIRTKIDIHIYDFSNMTNISSFLERLMPLKIKNRINIVEQASCLTVEFGEKLLLDIIDELKSREEQ